MTINMMKNTSFSPSSDQEWKERAEESLKGKKLESLTRMTYENIVLKPLYSRLNQTNETGYPGVSNFRRGIHALGYHTNTWKIAQKISYQNVEELRNNLAKAIEKGQTALTFKLKKELFEAPEKLERLLEEFIEKVSFAIQTDGLQNHLIDSLMNISENREASGYVAEDPLSLLVKKGSLPFELEEYFQTWAETIKIAEHQMPNLKMILIDTSVYHRGGANAVQELAIAIATGVYYLEVLKKHGLDPEKLFEKMIFKFQIGANFFMELSKLRSARVLWDKIGEAYGISFEKRKMTIVAETSSFTKTLNDHHVNILRSGNEAFAAILGGVQYLQVQAFNELEGVTPLAERLARNTQLILKEEAFLQKIVDPAGGSFYIESLTNELLENAWEYFLSIENQGGLLAVLQSNWLQSEISAVLNKRQQDTFTRKQSMVGTNVYANLQEPLKEQVLEEESSFVEKQEFHTIHPITQSRLAEPFEKLRQRAFLLKGNEVGLICLGELKEYKARADFMTGFLAAGGLNGVRSQSVKTHSDSQTFIKESNLRHYVLCGSNEIYKEIGLNILQQLKQEFPSTHFFLAGLPEKDGQEQWLKDGICGFVHVKTNCYEFINSIMIELEGGDQLER